MITALSAIGLIGVVSSSVVACDPVGEKRRKEISDHALDKYLTNTDLGEFEFDPSDTHGDKLGRLLGDEVKRRNENNPNVVSEITTKEIVRGIENMEFAWGDSDWGQVIEKDGIYTIHCIIRAQFDYFFDDPTPIFFYGGYEVKGSFTIAESSVKDFKEKIYRPYLYWDKDQEENNL